MEKINHPQHYGGDTTYEAIKVINAWGLNFELGNTAKYICRAGRKPGEEGLDDLLKAAWYLNAEIVKLKKRFVENVTITVDRRRDRRVGSPIPNSGVIPSRRRDKRNAHRAIAEDNRVVRKRSAEG